MTYRSKTTKFLLTALLFFAGLGVSTAQEADWTGFYFGVQAGSAHGHSLHDLQGPGTDIGVDQTGALVGLSTQYLWQVGRFAFGPQGEVFASNLHGETKLGAFNHFTSSVEWVGSVGVKAGVTVDNFMLFGTAGLAVGNVSGGQRNTLLAREHTEHQLANGFTVGLGADLQLQDGWTIGSEYRYYDFGPASMFTGVPTFQARTLDANMHAVSLHIRKKL